MEKKEFSKAEYWGLLSRCVSFVKLSPSARFLGGVVGFCFGDRAGHSPSHPDDIVIFFIAAPIAT